MFKQLMVSAAISTLMVASATAQGDAPATTPKAEAQPADAAKFLSSQSSDQWVFSKFKGTDVIGPDNAAVGDVEDILFDKNGKILGLIVGVGGFLGIGQKNVAIDMSAFQVVPASTGETTGAGGATTGGSASDDPTNVKLKVNWTKDQLKNAPEFQYHKSAARTGGTGSPGATPGRPAPSGGMGR